MTNEVPSDAWVVFGDVVIDVAGRRVLVNDHAVSLEPKAFDVLVLLARQSGQVLTRAHILDSVWGHRHVTPSVLNRTMTLIRQALKEDGERRQYLHTVYGIGYRLDASVRFFPTRPDARQFDSIPSDQAHASATSESADIAVSAAPGNLASMSRRPFRLVRWPAIFFVLVAAAIAWVLHDYSAELTTAPANASPTLVVMPLRPVGDDRDEIVFAEGLSEELITQLTHIEGLRLISSTSALRAAQERLDSAQLAQRLNVTHALEGSLRQSGDQLRIDLRLIAVPSGRTLWAQGYDRKTSDIFSVQQDIAQAVAAALTLHIGLAPVPHPIDPQVFREYLRLRSIVHNATNWIADVRQALPAMRSLVERAPDYAPAHGLLALALATGHLVPNAESEALQEATRALELDPDSLDGHAALAQRACQRTEWEECMDQLRIVHTLSPADSLTHLMHGIFLGMLGYREQALLQFQTANAADPLNYWTNLLCGQALDALGRHEEARRYFDGLPAIEPNLGGLTLVARWRNSIWRKDLQGAVTFARQMPEENHQRAAYTAVTAALLDASRWPQADAALGLSERELGETEWLRLFAPHTDIAGVMSLMESAVHDFDIDGMLIWAPEFSSIRRTPAFGELLKKMHMPLYWSENGWPQECEANGTNVRCQ